MRFIAAAALSVGLAAAAASSALADTCYFECADLSALNRHQRTMYMAGVSDHLTTFFESDAAADDGKRVGKCLVEADMDAGRLADDVTAWLALRTDLQKRSGALAVKLYLFELCGIAR